MLGFVQDQIGREFFFLSKNYDTEKREISGTIKRSFSNHVRREFFDNEKEHCNCVVLVRRAINNATDSVEKRDDGTGTPSAKLNKEYGFKAFAAAVVDAAVLPEDCPSPCRSREVKVEHVQQPAPTFTKKAVSLSPIILLL